MIDALIVGYGNTLRRDDGLGPFVAGSLDPGKVSVHARIRTLCLPQLDLSLAALLPEVDVSIFVDARHDGDDTLVRVNRIEPQMACEHSRILSHTTHLMSLPVLLGLAAQWYGKAPACHLVAPKGFDFSFGERLSEQARDCANLARKMIYDILRTHD